MSWTVACFCGSVYTAPPDRCELCGCTIEGAVLGGAPTSHRQPAAAWQHLAPERAVQDHPGPDAHRLPDPSRVITAVTDVRTHTKAWRNVHVD
jgi:hypothetical protein